jgi:divalent metal cation (Fe/Co/Zn/Cd) transporter
MLQQPFLAPNSTAIATQSTVSADHSRTALQILGATAIWLAYETKGLLIGESARREVVQGIRDLATATVGVDKVNEVLTMHMGPEFILATLSLEFVDGTSLDQVERTIADIDSRLRARFHRVKKVYIEAESIARPPEI